MKYRGDVFKRSVIWQSHGTKRHCVGLYADDEH